MAEYTYKQVKMPDGSTAWRREAVRYGEPLPSGSPLLSEISPPKEGEFPGAWNSLMDHLRAKSSGPILSDEATLSLTKAEAHTGTMARASALRQRGYDGTLFSNPANGVFKLDLRNRELGVAFTLTFQNVEDLIGWCRGEKVKPLRTVRNFSCHSDDISKVKELERKAEEDLNCLEASPQPDGRFVDLD